MRACTSCGVEKPLDAYTVDRKYRDGHMRICKACRAARQRELWKDPDYASRNNERRREWHQKHYRMRRYGITLAEYEQMFEAQGHKCRLCGCEKAGAGRDDQWCIDHCHNNGRIRGILCHNCNTALGYYERLVSNIGEAALLRYLHPPSE